MLYSQTCLEGARLCPSADQPQRRPRAQGVHRIPNIRRCCGWWRHTAALL